MRGQTPMLGVYCKKNSKVDLLGGREAVSSKQIAGFFGPGQQLSIWRRRRKNPKQKRGFLSEARDKTAIGDAVETFISDKLAGY